MRLVPNLAREFENVCAEYEAKGPMGVDLVALVKMFGDNYDHVRANGNFAAAWAEFLDEHKHQLIVTPMTGLLLYNLVTYWEDGQMFAVQLPTLERMLIRDTVSDISEEIDRRSAENGNLVIPVD